MIKTKILTNLFVVLTFVVSIIGFYMTAVIA
jgi:hypothetical protein